MKENMFKTKNGQSMIEFVALVMFILAAFIVFQRYIVRGFSGRWKSVGDSLGEGRLFDPRKTTECAYDAQYTDSWYDRTCWEANCEEECLLTTQTAADCTACINSCQNPYCD